MNTKEILNNSLVPQDKTETGWDEYNKATKFAMERSLDTGDIDLLMSIKTIMDKIEAQSRAVADELATVRGERDEANEEVLRLRLALTDAKYSVAVLNENGILVPDAGYEGLLSRIESALDVATSAQPDGAKDAT